MASPSGGRLRISWNFRLLPSLRLEQRNLWSSLLVSRGISIVLSDIIPCSTCRNTHRTSNRHPQLTHRTEPGTTGGSYGPNDLLQSRERRCTPEYILPISTPHMSPHFYPTNPRPLLTSPELLSSQTLLQLPLSFRRGSTMTTKRNGD